MLCRGLTWRVDLSWLCVVQVGLAKALSTGGQPTGLIQQDLQLGEGGGLEAGDSVEAKYTGWLLSNNTFGKVSWPRLSCHQDEAKLAECGW